MLAEEVVEVIIVQLEDREVQEAEEMVELIQVILAKQEQLIEVEEQVQELSVEAKVQPAVQE
jgi:hypothetical protein